MTLAEAHPDVAPVIRELDEHRERFVAFCRSLEEEELHRPVPDSTWIVRDFIAHLATIDPTVLTVFRRIKDGPEGAAPAPSSGADRPFNIDEWNDAQVAKRRGLPLEDVLAEAAENREHMRGFLATLDASDIAKPFPFEGDSKRGPMKITLLQYLRGWCKHDPMHAVDMLRALPERRTPDIEQWVDDPVVDGYQKSMNS